MKQKNLVVILMLLLVNVTKAQQLNKPPIDNNTYKNWTELGRSGISNNGKYAWYEYGTIKDRTLVFCTTDGKRKQVMATGVGTLSGIFTNDSKYFFVFDGLGATILNTENRTVQKLTGSNFTIPKNGDGRWVSYNQNERIYLKDLITGQEKEYPDATYGWFNDRGTTLIVQTKSKLLYISLPGLKEQAIGNGMLTDQIEWDNTGNSFVFLCNSNDGNTIWHYQAGWDSVRMLVNNKTAGMAGGLNIANEPPHFSPDGKSVYFKIGKAPGEEKQPADTSVITNKVDVWNYKDKFLQSEQLLRLPGLSQRTYTAVSNITSPKVIQLENEGTVLEPTFWPLGSKYVLIKNIVNELESYWRDQPVWEIVSIADGSRKKITQYRTLVGATNFPITISPGEHFVVWYDFETKGYYSYEIATGIVRNITPGIKAPLNLDNSIYALNMAPVGVAGWLSDDLGMLIYDRHDIWKISLNGREKPINISEGYGSTHHLIFRLASGRNDVMYRPDDNLLLTAFNPENKYNGFWRKQLNQPGNPVICGKMEPCLYYAKGVSEFNNEPPVKAKNAAIYLVQQLTKTSALNLFITKDFKNYVRLTDIAPEKAYNWMRPELVNWETADKVKRQGILYKPENFDPGKKYPVIFYYYEKFSDHIYSAFKKPGLSNGNINIPWYVSNGYLVFVPDIYYTAGHPGQSALNAVLAAAKYMEGFSWVDKNSMGLNGHSFGGYETNYIVTHTDMFAAAQSSSGMSDLSGSICGTAFDGQSMWFYAEMTQGNLRATPWERPDRYIENSPVFSINKVKTPLLIMHNKDDGAVPFLQSVEMFNSLRRLKKPVWLLQYDGEGHTIDADKACKLDFTIRQQQFFNHYLKGAPAPVWMTEGIEAKYKGVTSGLQLER